MITAVAVICISGILSYTAEISGVIEGIANKESRLAARSHLEQEDLRQEVRMACIKALGQFDPTRIGPSPYAFLQRCAKNHIYNLNRGTLVPNNPPCVRCPLWDKSNKVCTVEEVGCEKIVEYRKNMAAKASIKHADNLGDYETVDPEHSGDVDALLLHTSIKDMLPPELVSYYQMMISGNIKQVSPKHRAQVRKLIKEMLAEEDE